MSNSSVLSGGIDLVIYLLGLAFNLWLIFIFVRFIRGKLSSNKTKRVRKRRNRNNASPEETYRQIRQIQEERRRNWADERGQE